MCRQTLKLSALTATLQIVLLLYGHTAFAVENADTAADAKHDGREPALLTLTATELPPTVPQLRFVFACPDGLDIEVRWIAENVGDVAPPDYLLGKLTLCTKGPLNLTTYSRPTNGWPLGLYRLELRHEDRVICVQRYIIDETE